MERLSDDALCRQVDRAFLGSVWASLPWSERIVLAMVGAAVLVLLAVLQGALLRAAYPSEVSMLLAAAAWSAALARLAGHELGAQRERGVLSAWMAVLPEHHARGRALAAQRIDRRRRTVVAGAIVAIGMVIAVGVLPSGAWVFAAMGLLAGAMVGGFALVRPTPQGTDHPLPRTDADPTPLGEAMADWMAGQRGQRARRWRDTIAVGLIQGLVTLAARAGGVPMLPEATCVVLVVFFSVRNVNPAVLAALPLRVLPRPRGAWAMAMFGPTAWGHLLPPLLLWIGDPSPAHAFFGVLVVVATMWSLLCRIALAERPGIAVGSHVGAAAVVAMLGVLSSPLLVLHAAWCVRRWRR